MGSRAIGFYTLTFGPKTVASLAITQRGQVCLVPELRREGLQGLPRVVLPAIGAAVDKGLDAPLNGVNNALIRRVEATTASVDL